MSSVSTVFNPKEHCPWIAMLSGSGPMGDLGDNALYEIGRNDHGVDVKFWGATADSYMLWDQSADQLYLGRSTFTRYDIALKVEVAPTDLLYGCRTGAVSIGMYRPTTSIMTSWDGNADIAMKVYTYNYAANTTARGRIEGMEVLARNRYGSCVSVQGGNITAENYTGAVGVVDVLALQVTAKNNAVASGDVKVLRVFDESQSATGTTYGIELNCTSASAFAREYGIFINSGAGAAWTNGLSLDGTVTNVFDFIDSDGTNGATYSAAHYQTIGSMDGKIRVDIGGNTLYIPCYASIAA